MFLLEGEKKDGTWAGDTVLFFFFFGHIFFCLENGHFSSLSSFQAEIITLTSMLS